MASSSDQPRSELQTTTSSTSLGSVEVTVESISSGCNRPTKECNAVVCCVRVPNRLLQAWYHTKVCGDTDTSEDTSYIQLLNDRVRGKTLTFDVNCERLENNLYRRASEVAKRATRTKPNRARQQYLDKSTSFDILDGETVQASQLLEELELVNEDIEDWIERYEGSRETIERLREQISSATTPSTSSTASSFSSLNSTSSSNPASSSTNTSSFPHQLVNLGLPLSQVGERQRRRKVSALKESVQKVLLFVDSFGLTLQNVTMRDSVTGSPLSLNYGESPPPASVASSSTSLSDATLYQTLYLLERFGVSDEFYHELAMTHPALPRLVVMH